MSRDNGAVRQWTDAELRSPARSTLQLGIATVTPELAQHWLENAAPNRTISELKVAALMRDIASGGWKVNGETLKFDTQGRVMDGQHRLWAVFNSGKAITTAIALGVPYDTVVTVDVGRMRSAGDQLHLSGMQNATSVAAVARLWSCVDRGLAPLAGTAVTMQEIIEALNRHPTIAEGVRLAKKGGGGGNAQLHLGNAAFVAFALSAALVVAPEKARQFSEDLRRGTDLDANDPAFRLRERLLQIRLSSAKPGRVEVLAWILKAVNAALEGKTLKTLSFKAAQGEEFPPIPGVTGKGGVKVSDRYRKLQSRPDRIRRKRKGVTA